MLDLCLELAAFGTGIAHPLPSSLVRAFPQDLLSQTRLKGHQLVVWVRAHCQSEIMWWLAKSLYGVSMSPLWGVARAAPCWTNPVPDVSNSPSAGHS